MCENRRVRGRTHDVFSATPLKIQAVGTMTSYPTQSFVALSHSCQTPGEEAINVNVKSHLFESTGN